MNGKSIKKEYNINDFSFGQVAIISAPYEKYCKEFQRDIPMHHKSDREYTLLLRDGDRIIDLKKKDRKFYIPRDREKNSILGSPLEEDCQALGLSVSTRVSEEKSSVIEFEYPLGEYCQALGLSISTCTCREALKIVKDNARFFGFYTSILRVNKELEEVKRER